MSNEPKQLQGKSVKFGQGQDPTKGGRPRKFNARIELEEIAANEGLIKISKDDIVDRDGDLFVKVGNVKGVLMVAFSKALKGDLRAVELVMKGLGLNGQTNINTTINNQVNQTNIENADLSKLDEAQLSKLDELLDIILTDSLDEKNNNDTAVDGVMN